MFAYVGCRTTRERHARGEGISTYAIHGDGRWTLHQLLPVTPNPSFLALDPERPRLYCVHGDHAEASAFAIADDGSLAHLDTASTGGDNPVHLVVARGGRHLLVANYASGSLAVLPIHADGSLGDFSHRLELPGEPGPHRVEQPGSHPHQLLDVGGDRYVVCDKGVDRVFVVAFDPATEALSIVDATATKAGAGPRHAVFDRTRERLYVANELDSSVARYFTTFGAGIRASSLAPREVVTTLPRTCVTTSHAAGIALTPCGNRLYVSNRGDDSVACFAATPDALESIGWMPSGGAKPRFIALDPAGRTLHVANEDGDSIRAFNVDAASGMLTKGRTVAETGSPVCIVFRV